MTAWNQNSILLVLLLSSSLIYMTSTQIAGKCPSDCSCSGNGTIRCFDCIAKYFRTYSPSENTCLCDEGFKELEVPGLYCCPQNCTVCSSIGNCVRCGNNWRLQTNKVGVDVCVCRQYFFNNGTNCICLSHKEPSNYYWVQPDDTCHRCPTGCVCKADGCVSCNASTKRVVKTVKISNTSQVKVCECPYPLEPTDAGCQCPASCNCTNRNITCSKNGNRFLFDGNWQCKDPFMEQNGKCVCLFPYQLVNTICLCYSRIGSHAAYFSRQGECVPCPKNCTCDHASCVSVDSSTNRFKVANSCPCKPPYREIRGKCECFAPFYYNVTSGRCVCMSESVPTQYYRIPNTTELEGCKKCPDGCTCSAAEGCYTCKSPLRSIISINSSYSVCHQCVDYAYQSNWTCVCADSSQSTSDGKCGCTTGKLSYQEYVKFGKKYQCRACPPKCRCNETHGCYQCQNDSFRNVSKDPDTNQYTCKCFNNSVLNDYSGECYCQVAIDPNDATKCICPEPYYTNSTTGSCLCSWYKDQKNYYADYYDNNCYRCPAGCSCSGEGCTYCEQNALRFVYPIKGKAYSECACLQNAGLYNSSCLVCPLNQFFSSRRCIPCQQCLTCNSTGACTSCSNQMNLTNGTCDCINKKFKNIDGSCRCPIGSYYFQKDNCEKCPANCYDCHQRKLQEGSYLAIFCLVCNIDANRINNPKASCPCMEGYIENSPITEYCCPKNCKSCNQTVCTECYKQMLRQLIQGQCVCIGNLIEQDKTQVCGCKFGYYRYDKQCQECPPRCAECVFNQTQKQVQCLSCPNNSNRNSSNDCNCNKYFVEDWPVQYCYAKHCSVMETPCKVCKNDRAPSIIDSSCVCKYGYYEDSNGYCDACRMDGCLNCTSLFNCLNCNESYYHIEGTCQRKLNTSEYFYSQSTEQIVVQFKKNSSIDTSKYNELSNVTGLLRQNQKSNSEPVQLTVIHSIYTSNDTLTIRFSHPKNSTSNVILAIQYIFIKRVPDVGRRWNGTDKFGKYLASDGWVYISISKVYSEQQIRSANKWHNAATIFFVFLTLTVCCAIYIKGFKHNQTVFFLQTMSFLAFVIKDDEEIDTAYLYSIRTIYFQVGNILRAVIPRDYLESSKGNFPYLTGDSNIVRVAGTTLVIAATVAATSIAFRCIWFICRVAGRLRANMHAQQFIMSRKRFTYRFLEFLYKTCMYPIVFFAFVTFHNWQAMVLTFNAHFFNISHGIALAYFLAYVLVTMFQIWWETIAKVNKAQNALEFVSICMASLIMCLSIHTKLYLLLIVLLAFRASTYLMVRKRILRDFHYIEYLKLLSTLFEISALVCSAIKTKEATITFMVLAVITQLAHGSAIIFISEDIAESSKKGELDSIIPDVSQTRLSGEQSKTIIQS